MKPIKDYHLHTTFGDGKSSINAMAKRAKELGFQEIAFTEHFSWFFQDIPLDEVDDYFNDCRQAEQRYGIRILKGFEINYLKKDQEETKRFIEKKNPDILLLSVHNLELKHDWKRKDGRLDKAGYSVYLGGANLIELIRQYKGLENLCRAYFERIYNSVNAGFENICPEVGIAHLNVFHGEKGYYDSIVDPFMEQAVETIADKDLALELNLHYFDKKNPPRPSFEIGNKFCEKGGEKIWLGSDSHSVKELEKAEKKYNLLTIIN